MPRMLYETDPYLKSFQTEVRNVKGDWIFLEETAFFPGGGGQEADRGTINGIDVVEIKAGDGVGHKIPGHSFSKGQKVKGEIDWDRRYDLMRAHTGEHLLFSCLEKLNPEIQLVKIALNHEKKSLVVRGTVDWELVLSAEKTALDLIENGAEVKECIVQKDDPLLSEIRIKFERIHGDKVRIIQIGCIDKAACAGVHVSDLNEVEMILVTKLSAGKNEGETEIEFEVGPKAKGKAAEMAWTAAVCSNQLGAQPSNLLSAVFNLKKEVERMSEILKKQAEKSLSELSPELVGGAKFYHGFFEGVDKKTISIAAGDIVKEENAACVLMTVSDRVLLIVACHPALSIDCLKILNDSLSIMEGKGGGSKSFATGGSSQTVKTPEGYDFALKEMRRELEAQGL